MGVSKCLLVYLFLSLMTVFTCCQQYPVGDIRNCNIDQGITRLNALPGLGFDNLRNIDTGRVYDVSYSKCMLSDDGRFVLPDGAYLSQVLNSEVDYSASVYDHFDSHVSTTAASVNVEAKYSNAFSDISGKFSTEYMDTKTKMVESSSRSVRIGVRHHLYSAYVIADAKLDPAFKTHVMDIAANIQNNNTELAHYLSDLLVRSYGTHAVTSIDIGGILYQTSFVSNTYEKSSSSRTTKISATASANFYNTFSISTNFQFSTSNVDMSGFSNSTTHSHTSTFGGPPFRADNFSYSDWEDGLLSNLVTIDRRGAPLHTTISIKNIPELPYTLIRETVNYVSDAVSMYYSINTHPGCTDPDSNMFNFQANADDGSCAMNQQNSTFGGVYQTCSGHSDVCDGMSLTQRNPLTDSYSCPTGYHSILLHSKSVSKPDRRRDCNRRCSFFGLSCREECTEYEVIIYGTYFAYWCAFPPDPNNTVPSQSGYMFGGIYSPSMQNPITGSKTCPMYFYPLNFGSNLKVCVSNDANGIPFQLPFGGFKSCQNGNALAATYSQFMQGIYPDMCPLHFSQFLATVDDGCSVNYCSSIQSMMRERPRPPIIPPYRIQEELTVNMTETLALQGPYGQLYVKQSDGNWVPYTTGNYGSGLDYLEAQNVNPITGHTESRLSTIVQFVIAILVIIVIAVIVVVITVVVICVVYKYRKRRKIAKVCEENDQDATTEETELQVVVKKSD